MRQARAVKIFASELNNIVPSLMREFGRRQANALFRGKITFPQFFILEHLARSKDSTMTGLARFMRITTAAMTGAVARLVEAGLCRRVHDRGDRRVIRVRLTPRGIRIVRRINAQRCRMIVSVFGKLSDKERGDYLKIIRRVHDIMAGGRKQ